MCHVLQYVNGFVAGLIGKAPNRESEHAQPEKTLSRVEATAAKPQSRWRCLPVCCPLPPGVRKGDGNACEETEAKRRLDVEEEVRPSGVCVQGFAYNSGLLQNHQE